MNALSLMRSVMASAMLLVGIAAPAFAQPYVREFVPRQGERRLGHNIFKASHNSYERNETYVAQLDEWNCWALELDLVWKDGALRVAHSCGEETTLLSTALDRINDSITTPYRVTIVHFEFKSDCDGSTPAQTIYDNLVGAILTHYSASNIYAPPEFGEAVVGPPPGLVITGDNKRWPSWQELVRRQKRWIFAAQNMPGPDSPYFFKFRGAEAVPDVSNPPLDQYRALYNLHENEASGPFSDYWLSRGYPDPACGESGGAGLETQTEWNNGVTGSPFNIVATNCISNDHTNSDYRVHPPQPCFVRRNDVGSANEYGTLRDPFWGLGTQDGQNGGLLGAVYRVNGYGDLSEIWVQPGDYDYPGPIDINGPCIIINEAPAAGAVVIR